MGVDVYRCGHLGVAEDANDGWDRDVVFDHQRRSGMAEGVKARGGQVWIVFDELFHQREGISTWIGLTF